MTLPQLNRDFFTFYVLCSSGEILVYVHGPTDESEQPNIAKDEELIATYQVTFRDIDIEFGWSPTTRMNTELILQILHRIDEDLLTQLSGFLVMIATKAYGSKVLGKVIAHQRSRRAESMDGEE
jgi:hypothetical protein